MKVLWLLPVVIAIALAPNEAVAQSCEGQGCSAFDPCCEGYYCSALEGFECMPKREPGQQCGPDAHCLEGLTCMPTLDNLPTCVLTTIDTAAGQVCSALRSSFIADMVQRSQQTLALSAGEFATALVGASVELGVAYGANGEFGCFATVCGGITSDVSIGAFASIARYDSYADIQGISVLVTGSGSTPIIEVGGSAGNIYAVHEPTSLEDFATRTLIGNTASVSIGVGLVPAQFTTNMCYTEIIGGDGAVKSLDEIVARGEDAIRKLRAGLGETVADPRGEAVGGAAVDPFSAECQALSDERAMISGVAFGLATEDDIARWRSLQCQTTPSPEATPGLCQTMSDEFRISPADTGRATGVVKVTFESLQCTTVPGDGNLSCQELSDRYAIVSGSGFGMATPEAMDRWRAQECKTRPTHDAIPNLCQTMSNEYGISQQSFGRSTPAVRKSFYQLQCRTQPTVPQPGTRGCSGRGCSNGGSSSTGGLLVLLLVVGSLVRIGRRRSGSHQR